MVIKHYKVLANSGIEAISDVRTWYKELGIALLHAPVASKCFNGDQVYQVKIEV